MRIKASKVVTPAGVVDDGVLVVDGDRIVAVERGGTADLECAGWLVPGFVDTHTHGGGGVDFCDPDATPALEIHRRHGSTSIIGSTVTNSVDVLVEQATRMADLCDAGELAGIHLEGPCLAHERKGAHNPDLLRDPTPDVLDVVIDAARGHVRMVTLATEREGGLAAVERLAASGVVAAFGHSDADAAGCRAAVDAGASVATHTFNAMRGILHREPGPVPVLLHDPRVTCEFICDGIHVAPEVVRMGIDAAGVGRVSLVTDAMSATGRPDGDYPLGAMTTRVIDGVAKILNDDGTLGAIAGSTLTMDRAVEFVVNRCGCSIPEASLMASTTPAAALGLVHVGTLEAGKLADACLLDDDARLLAVMRRGVWLTAPPSAA